MIDTLKNKSKNIAEIIINNYDYYLNDNEILKEIWKISLSEANLLLFYNVEIYDEKTINDILSNRLSNTKEIKKMNNEEKLWNVMKIYILDYLNNNNIFL